MDTSTFKKLGAGITLSLLAATALQATNGDNLISVGAKARGMGGTGIAVSRGAESALNNPAMITSVEGTQISFGGTLFMPDIHTSFGGNSQFGNPGDGNPMNPGSAFFDQPNYGSEATRSVIPSVSIAHKIDENWYIGVGMFGTAGMGTDYRNAGVPGTITPPTGKGPQPAGSVNYANLNMVTNLQLMQFAVPVAYKTDGFTIAASAILQYGNLDINYKMPTPGGIANIGNGLAQDFGFGWNAGASYDFSNGLVIGAMYKSKISMTYDGQLSSATAPFVAMGAFPAPMADSLDQPAEYGAGLSYNMGEHTFAFDYKKIKWSDASGYKGFGWDDSDVYAFGYEYVQDNWALRVGYNYASSPVIELNGAGTPAYGATSAINFFNLLGFPATAEQHYTIGGTYALTEVFSIDLAYVYSPTKTTTFDIGAFGNSPMDPNRPGFGITSITNEHQEDSVSFQLNYTF